MAVFYLATHSNPVGDTKSSLIRKKTHSRSVRHLAEAADDINSVSIYTTPANLNLLIATGHHDPFRFSFCVPGVLWIIFIKTDN